MSHEEKKVPTMKETFGGGGRKLFGAIWRAAWAGPEVEAFLFTDLKTPKEAAQRVVSDHLADVGVAPEERESTDGYVIDVSDDTAFGFFGSPGETVWIGGSGDSFLSRDVRPEWLEPDGDEDEDLREDPDGSSWVRVVLPTTPSTSK